MYPYRSLSVRLLRAYARAVVARLAIMILKGFFMSCLIKLSRSIAVWLIAPRHLYNTKSRAKYLLTILTNYIGVFLYRPRKKTAVFLLFVVHLFAFCAKNTSVRFSSCFLSNFFHIFAAFLSYSAAIFSE